MFVPQPTENDNPRHQKFLEMFIRTREYKHNIHGHWDYFKIENLIIIGNLYCSINSLLIDKLILTFPFLQTMLMFVLF